MDGKEISKYTEMSEQYRASNDVNEPTTKPEAFVLWITPEMAANMLQNNTNNRKISPGLVSIYRNDINRGEWELNGETICLGVNGTLKDGQHRLKAIVDTGKAVQGVVVFNVPDTAHVYDVGRKRSIADVLSMKGISPQYANKQVTAIANLYEQMLVAGRSNQLTSSEVEDFINKHSDGLRFVLNLSSGGKNTIGSFSVYKTAMLFAYEGNEDPDRLVQFNNIATHGDVATESDTAAVRIREMVLSKKLTNQGGSAVRSRRAFTIERAIKDFCQKKNRKKAYPTEIEDNGPYSSVIKELRATLQEEEE